MTQTVFLPVGPPAARGGRCFGWAAAAGLALSTQAAVIQTWFTDLPDAVVGEDLWRGTYQLSEADFAAGEGFTLYFDHAVFRALSGPLPPLNSGWDLLLIQTDAGLPDDGFLDGLALTDGPELAHPFLIDFIWLGGGLPDRAQPFELYDLRGGFAVTESGTSVVVPEPATWSLGIGFGLAAWALRRRLAGAGGRRECSLE
jgi:hypothetical protein